MKKRLLKLCCILLLLPLLSGCLEEETDLDSGFLLPDESQTEAEVENNTLVLPLAFSLPYTPEQTLDPITCADGIQQVVGALVYEGLFRLDLNLEPQPRLCAGYTYDAATFTYVFTLRSGVTFSDGSPLTAADVVASLRRARSSQRYGTRLAQATTLTAGDGTVTVTLSATNTGFPALLDIPIVKSGTESSAAPIGTGPYQLTTDEAGFCLTVHQNWWEGGQRPVERIGLSPADDRDSMLYQFTSHDVQLVTTDLTGTAPISATGNVAYQDADTTVLHYLGFNVTRAPFNDAAVRHALGLGINRTSLVSAFLSGHGVAAQFPVSPKSPLYPAELEEAYSYDAFASAMADAGCATGQAQSVTLLVNAENTFKVSAAEHLAETLSAFDLKLQVEALPWAEYTAALAAGNFDLYYGEVRLTADWDLRPLTATGGALNYGGWTDVQTDSLLAAYAGAEDRAAAMARLCARLYQQSPILPICFKSTSVLVQAGVVDSLTPTAADPFYSLPDWTIHLRED